MNLNQTILNMICISEITVKKGQTRIKLRQSELTQGAIVSSAGSPPSEPEIFSVGSAT